MTTKRKAELQRKLSMAPLPKPPDGLLDRIKRDIPDDLGMTRDRFSRFNKLSLGVAASVLVLVGGAFFAMRMLSEMEMAKQEPAAAAVRVARPAAAPAVTTAEDRRDAAASTTTVAQIAEVAPPKLKALEAKKEQPRAFGGVVAQNKDAGAAVTAAAPPVAMADAIERAKVEERESAAAPAPLRAEAQAPPPAAPAMMSKSSVAENITVVRPELFGISTDRGAFDRIKFAIEHGERPAAATVDVAALVNYFAGGPSRIRRDAALDLEASSRPVQDGSATALVRVSIDTSTTIRDATLAIGFDPLAVGAWHRVGGGSEDSALHEAVVPPHQSVTALYEVTLRPNVRTRQAVATAKLTYLAPNGRTQTLERWVSYGEASGAWNNRSRRHRLATLGATWGETLRASAAGTDVAMKAEELSKQEPRDEKAKELATLATASSRLRSSSPTGSGR